MAVYRFDLTTRQISAVTMEPPPEVTIQATGTATGTSTVLGVSGVREATGTAAGTSTVLGVGAFIGVGQAVGTAEGRATVQGYAIPIRTGQGTGQAFGTSTAVGVGRGLIIREAVGAAQGAATVDGVANYDPHFSKVVLFMPGEFSDGATPIDQSRYRRILTTDGGAQVVNDDSPDGVVGSVRCWRSGWPSFSGVVVTSAGSVPPEMNITGRTFTFETFCQFNAVGADVVETYGQRGDVFEIGKSVTYEYGVWSEGLRVFMSDPYTVVAQFTDEVGGVYAFAAPIRYPAGVYEGALPFFHLALVVEGGVTVRIYTNGVHTGGGIIGPYSAGAWAPQAGNVVIGHRYVDVYDAENPIKDRGFGGFLAQLRLTMDVARYTGPSFAVPPLPFARYGD